MDIAAVSNCSVSPERGRRDASHPGRVDEAGAVRRVGEI